MVTTVLEYNSRWKRFCGLRKFKREHPNVKILQKWRILYGDGVYVPFHVEYGAKIEY